MISNSLFYFNISISLFTYCKFSTGFPFIACCSIFEYILLLLGKRIIICKMVDEKKMRIKIIEANHQFLVCHNKNPIPNNNITLIITIIPT